MQYLCDLNQFVYRHIGEQLLWATSMPCMLSGDAEIPIARYGRSNIGRMKEVYRLGLGNRYGRLMQAISGVHFNYSFPQQCWRVPAEGMPARQATASQVEHSFISAQYFGWLGNYRRHGWLIRTWLGNWP